MINQQEAEKAIYNFLCAIGHDPSEKEGLKDTPKRFVKFYTEFLNEEKFNMTSFDSENYDGMIISKDIPFFSLCEHHLVPFFGTATIGYIPGESKKIIGISKLPRTLEKFARQLQNQERITKNIVEYLEEKLHPKGIMVILEARHLCQEIRGVKKPGTKTITSAVKGVFENDMAARTEFLNLIKLS
jgi:GTP cyclohydrolase IA